MGRRLFGNKVSFSATFRKHPTFLKETYPDVDASGDRKHYSAPVQSQNGASVAWKLGVFLDPSLPIYGILWSPWGSAGLPARVFSYKNRTMDRAMGPFWPLWQF